MKRLLILTIVVLFSFSFLVQAQAPLRISYQGIIRDAAGNLLVNQSIGMRVTIMQGSSTGTEVFKETYFPLPHTNINGMVTLDIGSGIPVIGSLSTINWGAGPFFIKTETDPAGGSNYLLTATSQLLSVPYSFYANKSGNGVPDNNVVPRIATRNQKLSVSFSGGDNLVFSQSSSVCPSVYADVILKMTQSSTTIIYPTDKYYISPKRFDAVFDIPYWVPAGMYDVIIGPNTSCPYTISASFKIY
jgi:hypothetical protein